MLKLQKSFEENIVNCPICNNSASFREDLCGGERGSAFYCQDFCLKCNITKMNYVNVIQSNDETLFYIAFKINNEFGIKLNFHLNQISIRKGNFYIKNNLNDYQSLTEIIEQCKLISFYS